MLRIIKDIKNRGILIFLFIIITIVMIYSINMRLNISSTGKELGIGFGKAAGRAVGSFEGMTTGSQKGTEAGKDEGLSAEDTKAKIEDEIKKIEKLEVLVASVKLSDFHKIGEKTNYAALYLGKGNVVFSVDLSKAEISSSSDSLLIKVPKPKGDLYIENDTITKVAEYQKKFFNGSAEDGFDAYLNTMKKMQEVTEDTLNNYDSLVASAEKAAENQIQILARSVNMGNERQVVVTFAE